MAQRSGGARRAGTMTSVIVTACTGRRLRAVASGGTVLGLVATLVVLMAGSVSADGAAKNGAPVNTAPPAITGTAGDGQTLTSTTGTWSGASIMYTRQWQRCDAGGGACVDIAAATQATYVLTSPDVGRTLRVRVIATTTKDSAQATSSQTAVVAATAPANATLPTLTGTARDAQALTVASGTWRGTTPLAFTQQWLRCDAAGNACTDVAGQTAASYVLTAGDVGRTIRARVTASNAAGSAQATTAASAVVASDPPATTVLPSLSGTLNEGRVLTADRGSWTGTPPIIYTYQWQRCTPAGACSAISGATATTYELASADVGQRIRVVVTGANAAATSPATSAQSNPIALGTPLLREAPVLSGAARDGQTLSSTTGSWAGSAPMSFAYQWLRCDSAGANCATIGGAGQSSYGLAGADVGGTIRARVTGSNSTGSTQTTTAQSAVVAANPPGNTVLPSLSGTAVERSVLSADRGSWTGTPTISYTYEWQRCAADGTGCSAIDGATQSSYALTGADVGHAVRVSVTATNNAGSDSARSAASVTITGTAPANTSAPATSGAPLPGNVLSATTGEWSGTSPMTYAYQWLSCDAQGAACRAIALATADTYAVGADDVGAAIRVRVTATNSSGEASASSPAAYVQGAGCTTTFTATSGLWATAANWSTGSLPAAADHVCVPGGRAAVLTTNSASVATVQGAGAIQVSGGTLTVDDATTASTIADLSLTSGILNGAGELRVSRSLSWSGAGATMSGTGSTVLLEGATGTITAPADNAVVLSARSLINRGTLTHAAGALFGSNGATLRNYGTLRLNAAAESTGHSANLQYAGGTLPQVVNMPGGTVEKTQGSTTTRIAWAIDNQGLLDVGSGQLQFVNSGTLTARDASRLAGAISIQGSATASIGAVDGDGAVLRIDGGTLTTTGSQPGTIGDLTLATGLLNGSGELRVSRSLAWSGAGAAMRGTGSTVLLDGATGTITAPSGNAVVLDTRLLVNRGTLTFAAGALFGSNGAALRNYGVFNLNASPESTGHSSNLFAAGGTVAQLVNMPGGTVQKIDGTSPTRIAWAVDNQGLFDGRSGQLQFLNGGTLTSRDASRLGGSIGIQPGSTARLGAVDADGAALRIDGGTLTADDGQPSTVGDLTLASTGVLNGPGELHVSRSLSWSGAGTTMSGAGRTILDPGSIGTITSPSNNAVVLDGRTLINRGTLTHSAGALFGRSGATLLNEGDLNLDANADSTGHAANLVNADPGAPPHLKNALGGRVRTVDGTGETRVQWEMTNDGTIEIGPTRKLTASSSLPNPPCLGGNFSVVAGAIIDFKSGSFCFAKEVSWTGAGLLSVSGAAVIMPAFKAPDADVLVTSGSLVLTDPFDSSSVKRLILSGGTLAGPGPLTVSDTFQWFGGSMTGLGTTTLAGDGHGVIAPVANSGALLDGRTLVNEGELELAAGSVIGRNLATLANVGILRLNSEVTEYSAHVADIGGLPSILLNLPGGTIRKDTGTGETKIGFRIDNQGAVDVQTGDLTFTAGGIPSYIEDGGDISDPFLCPQTTNLQRGTWTANPATNASVNFTAGCFATGGVVSGNFNIRGAAMLAAGLQGVIDANVRVEAGTLSLPDPTAPSAVKNLYVSATMTGPGDISICGSLTWQAGRMTGSGSTLICPGATGSLSPPTGTLNLERVLVNHGNITWDNGPIVASATVIVNVGTWRTGSESPGGLTGSNGSLIDNRGRIVKDFGEGTTDINIPVDNPGVIERLSGTLHVQGKTCQLNSGSGDDTDEGGSAAPTPTAHPPDFGDPSIAPGPDWEWRGQEPEGGENGAWFNPSTGESWHPDLTHPEPIGPHWDYNNRDGSGGYRWGPDGALSPKHSACS